jgi:hypothetical protein
MAELVERDTHAAAIERVHNWVVNDEFPQQLIRAIRTRLDHLTDTWSTFVRAHTRLLLVVNDDDERQQHLQRYTDVEDNYLHAAELMNERIYETNQPQAETRDSDQESEIDRRSVASHDPSHSTPLGEQVVQVSRIAPGTNQLPWQFRL